MKVVTEASVVYLLGLVKRAEAEEAIKSTVAPPKPKDGAQTLAPAPKAAKPVEKVAAEEVEEPTKAVSKKATPPADEAPKLADLVDGWDD